MPVLYIFLAAWISFIPAPVFSADEPASGQGLPQNHCFCVQYTNSFPMPYYIGKLNPSTPECAGMKYAPDGKTPRESGLLTCDQLKKCANPSVKYQQKKKILDGEISQASLKLAACCSAGHEKKGAGPQCDAKCQENWRGILKVLAGETEKLEKNERLGQEQCFTEQEKKAKETAADKTGPK